MLLELISVKKLVKKKNDLKNEKIFTNSILFFGRWTIYLMPTNYNILGIKIFNTNKFKKCFNQNYLIMNLPYTFQHLLRL